MAQIQNIQELLQFGGLYQRVASELWSWPGSISRYCGNARCKKETTWKHTHSTTFGDMHLARYECQLCVTATVSFAATTSAVLKKDQKGYHYVWTKVGQDPAPSIEVSSSLEKQLGENDVALYKKGLVCRNQAYGLGALIYFRRVVENKTNEMIDTLAELARQAGATDSEVETILAAKKEQRYENRINMASLALPRALQPGGHNPLRALFSLCSDGVHSRTDEEALNMADELREIFEWSFSKLRAEVEDHNRMKAKLAKMGQRDAAS